MVDPDRDFLGVLSTLVANDVNFVVVGALAAAVQGAPLVTLDVDVVHERSAANVERLLRALDSLDAKYRDPAGRALRPTPLGLESTGHHLLVTRCGPFDVLGAIEEGLGFRELAPRSVRIDVDEELQIRVLSLAEIVRLKEGSSREKDQALLPTLRRTLAELRRKG